MKTIAKILAVLFLLVVLAAGGAFLYVKNALPDVGPPPNVTVESTPERLERGQYLVEHVTVCTYCHSKIDTKTGQIPEDMKGAGHTFLTPADGFPGTLHSQNITPAGLGDWSDGEIVRAIRSGVSKNGEPLFPIMPYGSFKDLSEEDLFSIIAYLKTLPAVEGKHPRSELEFPLSLIVHLMPQAAGDYPKPVDRSDTVAYGKYLAEMASCSSCHTPVKDHEPDMDNLFGGGGVEFPQENGLLLPPNITPDEQYGIGNWTREAFIARFKAYQTEEGIETLRQQEWNTQMPWIPFSGMTDEDLGAIYDYLRTVKPSKNEIVRWAPKKSAS